MKPFPALPSPSGDGIAREPSTKGGEVATRPTLARAGCWGVCQWFHYEDRERALTARDLLRELGARHLRIDISWADYHRTGGAEWYDWLFDVLQEFELLPCIWHTPPSLSMSGKSNGPPENPQMLADFIWEVTERHGKYFTTMELWNEPNNQIKWDQDHDPEWRRFAEMVAWAAGAIACAGKRVVLGGMSPIDGGWLDQLRLHDEHVLRNVEIIGVHAFPGQWNERDEVWGGWQAVFEHLRAHVDGRAIWITEVGRSTPSRAEEREQVDRLLDLAKHAAGVERIYWYSLLDLPSHYDELEFLVGGYREPLEHSLGLVAADGRKKPAYFTMKELLQG
jgi:CDP-paratose 2-epimerase